MLDRVRHRLVQYPHDLDDVPWPQLGMNRQPLRARHAPIQCDLVRTQLRRGAVAPRAQRQHQVAADIVHRIDHQPQILQRRPRRVADTRSALAPLAQRDDADELAAQAVMKIPHQSRALARQRRDPRTLLLAGETRLEFFLASRSWITRCAAKPSTWFSARANRQVSPAPIAASMAE